MNFFKRKIGRFIRSFNHEAAGNGRLMALLDKIIKGKNTTNKFENETLRARSIHFNQNSGYARKACDSWISSVVHTGLKLSLISKSVKLERFMDSWNKWANSLDCDFNGIDNLYGIEELITRTDFIEGELIILRIINVEKFKRGIFPLEIRTITVDYLDESKTTPHNKGGTVFQGIEFDKNGRRVGCHLFDANPKDRIKLGFNLKSTFYPNQSFIHYFKSESPDQIRGIPRGVSSFTTLDFVKSFQKARLKTQEMAALFSIFAVNRDGDPRDLIKDLPDVVEPASITVLGSGQDIIQTNPPRVSGQDQMIIQSLYEISAGFGVEYQGMTGDFTKASFSGLKVGQVNYARSVSAYQRTVLIPKALDRILKWYIEVYELINVGVKIDISDFAWDVPAKLMPYPEKEIPVLIAKVRGGFMSLGAAIGEMGGNFDEVMKRHKSEKEVMDSMKLIFDTSSDVAHNGSSSGLGFDKVETNMKNLSSILSEIGIDIDNVINEYNSSEDFISDLKCVLEDKIK